MDYTDIKNTVIGLLMNVNDPDYRYFTEYWPKISHNKFIAFIKNGGIDLCGEHWDRVIYSDPMETIDFITMLTVENFGILYFEADPERIKLIAQNIKFFYFMCIVAHELYMNIKNNVYNIRGINLMNESAGVNLEVNTSFAGEIAHVFDLRYNEIFLTLKLRDTTACVTTNNTYHKVLFFQLESGTKWKPYTIKTTKLTKKYIEEKLEDFLYNYQP